MNRVLLKYRSCCNKLVWSCKYRHGIDRYSNVLTFKRLFQRPGLWAVQGALLGEKKEWPRESARGPAAPSRSMFKSVTNCGFTYGALWGLEILAKNYINYL